MKDLIEELKSTDDLGEFVNKHKKDLVKYAIVAVGIMTVLLLFVYRGGDELEVTETAEPVKAEDGVDFPTDSGDNGSKAAAGNGFLYVDIGGAVKSPKLAQLPDGSRVEDAIQEAGGLTSDADISAINRAELITDGQKIYIPEKGEQAASVPGTMQSGSGASDDTGMISGKVNINTADLTQLQSLTGVGPATAQKIIDYRTQNGRFARVEDLKNVSGIGDKTFEKMKDDVTV